MKLLNLSFQDNSLTVKKHIVHIFFINIIQLQGILYLLFVAIKILKWWWTFVKHFFLEGSNKNEIFWLIEGSDFLKEIFYHCFESGSMECGNVVDDLLVKKFQLDPWKHGVVSCKGFEFVAMVFQPSLGLIVYQRWSAKLRQTFFFISQQSPLFLIFINCPSNSIHFDSFLMRLNKFALFDMFKEIFFDWSNQLNWLFSHTNLIQLISIHHHKLFVLQLFFLSHWAEPTAGISNNDIWQFSDYFSEMLDWISLCFIWGNVNDSIRKVVNGNFFW